MSILLCGKVRDATLQRSNQNNILRFASHFLTNVLRREKIWHEPIETNNHLKEYNCSIFAQFHSTENKKSTKSAY